MPRQTQNSQRDRNRTRAGPSQQTLTDSFLIPSESGSEKYPKEFVNKCVRYFVFKAGRNLPVRKGDLQKTVLHGVGRSVDKVVHEASKILNQIYGLNVVIHEQSATSKMYFITNNLLYKEGLLEEKLLTAEDDDETQYPSDVHKVLTLLILAHIFMSGNVVPEASLISYLASFGIDYETKHNLFGSMKEFITTKLIKQKYLNAELDEGTRKVSYSWGPRAECEISKHQVLSFVCSMYGNCRPNSWTSQFEEANSQILTGKTNSADYLETMDLTMETED